MKRKPLLLLLVLLGLLPLLMHSQSITSYTPEAQITNIPNREGRSLSGLWRTIVDPFENGYYDYRREPIASGYFLDRDITDKSELQEYHFGTDKTLRVPGDWNMQRPELYYYEGTVWYRTRFDYTPTSERAFLYFGAVNYEAIVFLNGKELGRHIGGFTPFNFEVTELLREGENSLVVKVDNKRSSEGVPTLNSDWWNYGGITREVQLIETPATFIEDYYCQLQKGSRRTIEGWVQLNGADLGQSVTITLPELNKSITLTPNAEGLASFELRVDPQLWSPESPKRYEVAIHTPSDTLIDQVGFRTIETQGSQILLNGEPIFCRGISIHEEAPFGVGRVYTAEQGYTLLQWAKELGCNFVRLAHYPHNEQMVRQAEELGLMVWSEIPVYWTIQWENPDTYRNAEQQLEAMITRDKNRCNIIIWSVANETPLSEPRYDFMSRLIAKIRSMDGVRLVGAAMEKEELDGGVMTVNDPIEELLDIISFNQYVGWYGSLPEACDTTNWVFGSDKPVFVSEFGGGALYGYHGGVEERFSEEYQEDLYIRSLAMLDKIPSLAGMTPWILKDFRSPRRHLPHIQDDFNRKGLISDEGQRKLAFYILQSYYQKLAESTKK